MAQHEEVAQFRVAYPGRTLMHYQASTTVAAEEATDKHLEWPKLVKKSLVWSFSSCDFGATRPKPVKTGCTGHSSNVQPVHNWLPTQTMYYLASSEVP
jgi:hypothetical protein